VLSPWANTVATNSFDFTDSTAANSLYRFYRVRQIQ
jgi:hypothetical protein